MTRTLAALIVAALTAFAPAAAASDIVHATHAVSVEGTLVNHWTIDEPDACGLVGDGTLTVTFKTSKPARVLPYIDKFAGSETGHVGSWIIGVPLPPHAVKDLRSIPATGTITRVDNTTRRPQEDGQPCDPPEKAGCGTLPLRGGRGGAPKTVPSRYDKRRISVQMFSEAFDSPRKPCSSGDLSGWSDFRLTGGDKESGDLRLTMPAESALRRRRVVKVTGRDHKKTTLSDRLQPGSEVMTDDVTRTATVTFKRL
jgi:hypothetical protein